MNMVAFLFGLPQSTPTRNIASWHQNVNQITPVAHLKRRTFGEGKVFFGSDTNIWSRASFQWSGKDNVFSVSASSASHFDQLPTGNLRCDRIVALESKIVGLKKEHERLQKSGWDTISVLEELRQSIDLRQTLLDELRHESVHRAETGELQSRIAILQQRLQQVDRAGHDSSALHTAYESAVQKLSFVQSLGAPHADASSLKDELSQVEQQIDEIKEKIRELAQNDLDTSRLADSLRFALQHRNSVRKQLMDLEPGEEEAAGVAVVQADGSKLDTVHQGDAERAEVGKEMVPSVSASKVHALEIEIERVEQAIRAMRTSIDSQPHRGQAQLMGLQQGLRNAVEHRKALLSQLAALQPRPASESRADAQPPAPASSTDRRISESDIPQPRSRTSLDITTSSNSDVDVNLDVSEEQARMDELKRSIQALDDKLEQLEWDEEAMQRRGGDLRPLRRARVNLESRMEQLEEQLQDCVGKLQVKLALRRERLQSLLERTAPPPVPAPPATAPSNAHRSLEHADTVQQEECESLPMVEVEAEHVTRASPMVVEDEDEEARVDESALAPELLHAADHTHVSSEDVPEPEQSLPIPVEPTVHGALVALLEAAKASGFEKKPPRGKQAQERTVEQGEVVGTAGELWELVYAHQPRYSLDDLRRIAADNERRAQEGEPPLLPAVELVQLALSKLQFEATAAERFETSSCSSLTRTADKPKDGPRKRRGKRAAEPTPPEASTSSAAQVTDTAPKAIRTRKPRVPRQRKTSTNGAAAQRSAAGPAEATVDRGEARSAVSGEQVGLAYQAVASAAVSDMVVQGGMSLASCASAHNNLSPASHMDTRAKLGSDRTQDAIERRTRRSNLSRRSNKLSSPLPLALPS